MTIILAFFIGLISSVPIGPLGMIMLNRTSENGFWDGFSIALLDAIAGFIFSLLFIIGIGQIEFDPVFKLIAQIFGLIFLVFIFIKEIFFKMTKHQKERIIPLNLGSFLGNLLLVISYYISNPTLWVFWINISVYANDNLINKSNLFNSIFFSLLYALGSLTTQYLAIQLMKNMNEFEKTKKILKFFSYGLFMLTFSYFLLSSIQSLYSRWNIFTQLFNYIN